MSLTERGQREVGSGLREALDRLRRRKAELQAQMGILEVEMSDLGKIEAAIMLASEMAAKDLKR